MAKHTYDDNDDFAGKPELVIDNTDKLLAERGKTHGDYGDHARITQEIKTIYARNPGGAITNEMAESLDMIAHKIGRILAGDPDFRDHWDDIAGYAKLVANRCTK